MEKKIESREHCVVAICLKASGEEWTKEVKKEFNKRAAKVTVPGFRPGKAPANMIAQRVDQNAVYSDAVMALANDGLRKAIDEDKVYPWSEPKVDVKKVNKDEMECEVLFCTQPELKLGQYVGLNIPCEEAKVSADDVKTYIENLKKDHAIMQVKEGAAKKGDSVIIDFKGYIDDTPFDGGSAKGYELELGSNSFIPGFEDQLVGAKAGDKKTLSVKFPDNYVASLAGKDAKFDVEVLDVKEKVMPKLDEEFFKELNINDVKDEASLKEYAKKNLLKNKEASNKNAQVEKIINTAVANSTVVVPQSLIDQEEQAMLQEITKQVTDAGLKYEDYVKINGLKEEELRASRLKDAEKNLTSMIVIENIIAKEKLEVTDADVEKEYARIADMYKMDVKQVKDAFASNKENLVRQIRNQKFADFMLAHNEDKVGAPVAKEEAKPAAKKAPAKKTAPKKEADGEAKPAAKKPATKKATTKKDAE